MVQPKSEQPDQFRHPWVVKIVPLITQGDNPWPWDITGKAVFLWPAICSCLNCLINSSHMSSHVTMWICTYRCFVHSDSNSLGFRYLIKPVWWAYLRCACNFKWQLCMLHTHSCSVFTAQHIWSIRHSLVTTMVDHCHHRVESIRPLVAWENVDLIWLMLHH